MSQAEELLNAVAEDTMTGITWDGTISSDSVYITDSNSLEYYLVSKEIPKRHTYAAGATVIMLDREWIVKPIDSTKFGDNAYELMYTYDNGNTKLFAIVLTEEYYDEDMAISYPAGTYFHRLNDSAYVTFLQTFTIDGANSGLTPNDDDPHIVIGQDKIVTVPESLKKIAVQHDHNIETVTFDCPRYWDGIDFATSNAPPSGKYSWDGDILGREGFYRGNYAAQDYFYKVSSEVPAASTYAADSTTGKRFSFVVQTNGLMEGDGLTDIAGGYFLWSSDVGENIPYAYVFTSSENDYGVSPGVYFGWTDSELYTSSIAPAVPVAGVATIVNDFAIYINYMLPGDGELGSYVAQNLRVDVDNPELIHFDWTISSNVTKNIGAITFLVCARKVGVDGTVLHKWNSELCRDLRVSEGLETVETIVETQPDFITQVLTALDRFNQSEYGQVVTRIEALETAVNPGEDDVNIAGRLTTAETDINTLEDGMRSVNSGLVTLEGRADAAASDIDANTQDIAALGTRMTTAETNIINAELRMSDAESDIDALQEITGALGEGNALGIDRGGTGATTAEQARANLGVVSAQEHIGCVKVGDFYRNADSIMFMPNNRFLVCGTVFVNTLTQTFEVHGCLDIISADGNDDYNAGADVTKFEVFRDIDLANAIKRAIAQDVVIHTPVQGTWWCNAHTGFVRHYISYGTSDNAYALARTDAADATGGLPRATLKEISQCHCFCGVGEYRIT